MQSECLGVADKVLLSSCGTALMRRACGGPRGPAFCSGGRDVGSRRGGAAAMAQPWDLGRRAAGLHIVA